MTSIVSSISPAGVISGQNEYRSLLRQKQQELLTLNEQRFDELQADLINKQSHIDHLESNFSILQNDFKYNLKLISDRDAELEKYDGVVLQLKEALKNKENDIERVNTEIKRIKASYDSFCTDTNKTIRSLEGELDSTKLLHESTSNDLKSKFHGEIAQLERRLVHTHNELEEERKLHKLDLDENRSIENTYKRELELLTSQVEQLTELHESLKFENELKTANIQKSEETLTEAHKQLQLYYDKELHLTKEFNCLKEDVKDQDNLVKDLRLKNEEHAKASENYEKEIVRLLTQHKDHIAKIQSEHISKLNEQQRASQDESREIKNTLKSEIEETKKQLQEVKTTLVIVEAERDTAELTANEVAVLEKRLEVMEEDLVGSLRRDVKSHKADIQSLHLKVNSLQGELDLKEQEVKLSRNEKEKLQDENIKQQLKIEGLLDKAVQLKTTKTRDNGATDAAEEVTLKLEQVQTENEKYKLILMHMRQDAEALESRYHSLEESLRTEKAEKQATSAGQVEEGEWLRRNGKRKEEEVEELLNVLKESSSRYKEQTETLQAVRKQLRNVTAKNEQLTDELTANTDAVADLKKLHSEHDKELGYMRKNEENMREEYAMLLAEKDELMELSNRLHSEMKKTPKKSNTSPDSYDCKLHKLESSLSHQLTQSKEAVNKNQVKNKDFQIKVKRCFTPPKALQHSPSKALPNRNKSPHRFPSPKPSSVNPVSIMNVDSLASGAMTANLNSVGSFHNLNMRPNWNANLDYARPLSPHFVVQGASPIPAVKTSDWVRNSDRATDTQILASARMRHKQEQQKYGGHKYSEWLDGSEV
eukprot:Platyproteum_vivax@DN7092_c0_g1_i1.p1